VETLDELLGAVVHCCCAMQVFAGGSVCYAYTTIPTYPSGQIGMMVCCKGQQLDVRQTRQPAPGPLPALNIPPLR
jgi:spermidine synthase